MSSLTRQNLLLFRSKSEADLQEEKTLLRLCLQKDTYAFEKIVEKYRDQVYWVAYNLVLDSEDARDVSQQVFIKIWNGIPSFDLERPFRSWVIKIAANCSIDFMRSRKRTEPLQDIEASPTSIDLELDMRKIFDRVAPALPDRQRIALVLREIHGMEISEISDLMKCTESTVRNLLSQAKESFRLKVRELFPEYGL